MRCLQPRLGRQRQEAQAKEPQGESEVVNLPLPCIVHNGWRFLSSECTCTSPGPTSKRDEHQDIAQAEALVCCLLLYISACSVSPIFLLRQLLQFQQDAMLACVPARGDSSYGRSSRPPLPHVHGRSSGCSKPSAWSRMLLSSCLGSHHSEGLSHKGCQHSLPSRLWLETFSRFCLPRPFRDTGKIRHWPLDSSEHTSTSRCRRGSLQVVAVQGAD